jgi:hypothetical protein
MCQPYEEKNPITKLNSFSEVIGIVAEWLVSANAALKGLSWSQSRKFRFPCGEVYKITFERIS